MQTKNDLRQLFLSYREKLTDRQVASLSYKIQEKVFNELTNINARSILLYYAINKEVKTQPLIKELLNQGKEIYLPYIFQEPRRMEIGPVSNLYNDLVEGIWGIKEPARKENTPPDILDAVIVPGLVFSHAGYRIGYGGGYYDRFLAKLPDKTVTIGVTYSLTLVKSLPVEKHDIPVKVIITEDKVLYPGGVDN